MDTSETSVDTQNTIDTDNHTENTTIQEAQTETAQESKPKRGRPPKNRAKKSVATTRKSTRKSSATSKTTRKKATTKVAETDKDGPLHEYFIYMLQDTYYAEKQSLAVLEKMQNAATTEELQEAFEDHYLQTQKHISRLERVFTKLDENQEEKKCDAILGIIKEVEQAIKNTEEGSMTRDAALIISAQKIEHYEIASYGGLCALAETFGYHKVSDMLHKTLEEEYQADEELTHIAESFINFHAKKDQD